MEWLFHCQIAILQTHRMMTFWLFWIYLYQAYFNFITCNLDRKYFTNLMSKQSWYFQHVVSSKLVTVYNFYEYRKSMNHSCLFWIRSYKHHLYSTVCTHVLYYSRRFFSFRVEYVLNSLWRCNETQLINATYTSLCFHVPHAQYLSQLVPIMLFID